MTSMIKVDEIQNNAGTTTLAKIENGQLTGVLSPATGFRNRIINGDMRIDQRNAGAAVTIENFVVDRFSFGKVSYTTLSLSVQQVSDSAPNFNNSLKLTVGTGQSVQSPNGHLIAADHRIEGFNFADYGFGTADAESLTLSFWVKSSITGTYPVSFFNAGVTRAYLATYTISAANTWEKKTITVEGDVSGTWNTTNGIGIGMQFSVSAASGQFGTTDLWSGTYKRGVSGMPDLGATSGATWQITGVQLEKGTVATPFEFRSIGQELGLCQRYYYEDAPICGVGLGTGNVARATALHPVEMRVSPSVTISNSVLFFNGSATVTATGALTNYSNKRMCNLDLTVSSGGVTNAASCRVAGSGKITVSSEL